MKAILALLLLLFPYILSSQTSVYLKVGKSYKPYLTSNYNQRTEDPKTGNIVHFRSRKVEILDAKKLRPLVTNKFKNLPKRFLLTGAFSFNDKLYIIYSTGNFKTITYSALQVDYKTGKAIGEPKKFLELEGTFYGKPTITFSRKKNRGLFRFRKAPEKRDDAENFDIIETFVFNDNLDILSSGSLTMPYTEQKMDNISYFVGNDNQVYLLAKVRSDGSDKDFKKKGKKAILKSHIELIRFDLENKTTKITKLDLGEYNNNYITPYVDKKGIIRLVSFYSKSVSDFIPPANGILVGYLNPETGELTKKLYEIPLEILNLYENKRQKKKNEDEGAGLNGLFPRIVKWNDDNSLFIVGNQYLPSGITLSYDLLVAKINPDGELVYMNRVPKRGYSYSEGETNCYYMHNNHLYYFDIDNYQNLNLKKDDVPKDNRDDGDLAYVMFKINTNTGNFSKKSIFKYNQKKNGQTLSPRNIVHLSPIKGEGVLILSKEATGSYNFSNKKFLMKATVKETE